MKTAYATIKGFEAMRCFKKGQFSAWIWEDNPLLGEIRILKSNFGL